jgi:hypothetical protein
MPALILKNFQIPDVSMILLLSEQLAPMTFIGDGKSLAPEEDVFIIFSVGIEEFEGGIHGS